MDPKPVRVVFAEGHEELGILTDDNTLDVGDEGLRVHLNDLVIVDGDLMTVVGTSVRRTSTCSSDSDPVEETFFRLRLRPYPPIRQHVA